MNFVVIGSTGLVGKLVVKKLIEDEKTVSVTSISRRKLHIDSTKLKQIEIEDLNALSLKSLEISASSYICALGTTIKSAKTKENFRKVDYELALSFGQMAERSKCNSFHLVSAAGADKNSIFFYNKVKGEIENAISNLNIPSINIYRPSLLIGDRKEKRKLEEIGIKSFNAFENFLPNKISKRIGTKVYDLTQKIIANVFKHQNGVNFFNSIDF